MQPSRPQRPPQLDDPVWLRTAYDVSGRSSVQIADELGCSTNAVLAALRRNDIQPRPRWPVTNPLLSDRSFLVDAYVTRKLSASAIGNELGCSSGSVLKALRESRIQVRHTNGAQIPQLYDHNWLRTQVDAGFSSKEVAAQLGCAEATLKNALWRAGIRSQRPPSPTDQLLADPQFLQREYVELGRSARDVAAQLECTPKRVLNALRRHDLPVRPARASGHRPADTDVASTVEALAMRTDPPDDRTGPAEINGKTFSMVEGGYRCSDVDAFLRAIAREWRAAIQEEGRPPTADGPAWATIGAHVSSLLWAAACAAEETKEAAAEQVSMLLSTAAAEAADLRRAADEHLARAWQLRAIADQEAIAIRSAARDEAGRIVRQAREQAARAEQEARKSAAELDQASRMRADTLVGAIVRHREQLRTLQQDCVERLSSAEALLANRGWVRADSSYSP